MRGETTHLAFLLPDVPVAYSRLDIDDIDIWLEPTSYGEQFYASSDRGLVNVVRTDSLAHLPYPVTDQFHFAPRDGVYEWDDGRSFNLEIFSARTEIPPGEYEIVTLRRRLGGRERLRYPSEGGGSVILNVHPGDNPDT